MRRSVFLAVSLTFSSAILLAGDSATSPEKAELPTQASKYNFEKGKSISLLSDDLTVLMVENALAAKNVGSYCSKGCKNLFSSWNSVKQEAAWKLRTDKAVRCTVRLLARCENASWILGVGDRRFPVQDSQPGYQRLEIAEVDLPAGETDVTLRLAEDKKGGAFKSIEIVPSEVLAGMNQRAAAARSDAAWMRKAKYGVMLQFGAWGYPPHGDRLPWPNSFDRFDVDKFAKMVDEDMGAGWVIWSLTWRGSQFPMPLKSVDAIVPNHTMKRDFVGELADALRNRGIKLMFYYHPGHEDAEFWRATFSSRNDRSRFFENWVAIVTEIGQRYGDRLAGWFFDDGCVYYPAPFERLTKAAKTGNPNRLVTFNNWDTPIVTGFQDVMFGEGLDKTRGRAPQGSKLQSHSMFSVDGPDWGVWKPETRINPTMSAKKLIETVQDAVKNQWPVSIDFSMYDDGSISPQSLQSLRELKQAIRGNENRPRLQGVAL